MIEVKEIKSKKELKKFAAFPIKLYKNNPYYVPVFRDDDINLANPKKNSAAQGCEVKAFLAYKNGEIAGRIAAIIVNESNRRYNEHAVRFSRFDFIEDIEVAKALLNAAENFARERNMTKLHGPWGFNDTDREGMLISGFDKLSTYATNYNYEYYPKFMEELGYERDSLWLEHKLNVLQMEQKEADRYYKLGEYVKKKFKLTELCETMPLKQIIKNYGDKFFDCYNAAYGKLDMFVDITDDVKKVVLKQFATVINPRYLSVVVNEANDVVAFGVVLPAIGTALKKHGGKLNLGCILDLFKLIDKPKGLELTLIAVRPEYAKIGFTAVCFGDFVRKIREDQIDSVVSNPTLDSNTAVRAQWSHIPNEEIKRRQTYVKNIN